MPQIFDVSEKAPEVVEAKVEVAPARQNVQRKNVIAKEGKLGEIVHYHRMEDEKEVWDEPCVVVEHTVGVPGGLRINDFVFIQGKHVVPACTAGQLGMMESEWHNAEASLFRSKTLNRIIGAF